MPEYLTARVTRPEPTEYFEYYGKYISQVKADEVRGALTAQRDESAELLARLTEAQGAHRYAPGKWSVKEMLVHVADCERVFAYRALRFGRADQTPLPAFDENAWGPWAAADARPLSAIVSELAAVRAATIALCDSFAPEAFARGGEASGRFITVRALFWIIAGHELHHRMVLRERYGIGQ